MAKCKKCGHSGFFLFIQSGYCKDCRRKIEEYKFLMPQWLKSANELAIEMKEADQPDQFFHLYSVYQITMNKLSEYEDTVSFHAQKPSELFLKKEKELSVMINNVIHSFYEKTKQEIRNENNMELKLALIEKFKTSFDPYSESINSINKNTIYRYVKKLKEEGELINELESSIDSQR